MQTETLIIGGGLSGLSLATMLAGAGRSFHLVEARDRLGGRILTESRDGAGFDLGPAWIWPGQPRIAALIERLGLRVFEQNTDGAMCFEDAGGTIQKLYGQAPMQGSYRLDGGFGAVIDALAVELPRKAIILSCRVTELILNSDSITAVAENGRRIKAARAVLALPPRLSAKLAFRPAFDEKVATAMQAIPTWMAGQAKALAVYERPFWREAGLSGDAMSHRGPMVEMHDASAMSGNRSALFGFIGVPPQARTDEGRLRRHITDQFVRLFGPNAGSPIALFLKDWAHDPLTATELDQQPLSAHPAYGLPDVLANLWDRRLLFAGTEVGPQFGGYLEGALEAAQNVFAILDQERV